MTLGLTNSENRNKQKANKEHTEFVNPVREPMRNLIWGAVNPGRTFTIMYRTLQARTYTTMLLTYSSTMPILDLPTFGF